MSNFQMQSSSKIPSSGILLVDKPKGVTSHDVVSFARGLLHTKRVGHAGTLDPMATGLLILGFGNATRLLNYLLGHNKTYEAVIRLGESTNTDDADGDVVSSVDDENGIINFANIDEILKELRVVIAKNFTGSIMQTPTSFSAIKVNGVRAYDLAREGKDVHLEPREVFIYDFSLLDAHFSVGVSGVKVIDVRASVSCSSGTYIRALARDLGRVLGVGGHLVSLRRTRIGDFSIEDSRVLKLKSVIRTFTNKNGVTQTRAKAVLDDSYYSQGSCESQAASDSLVSGDSPSASPASSPLENTLNQCLLSMFESAKLTMQTVEVSENQAKDLRFGRKITISAISAKGATKDAAKNVIAYVKATKDEQNDVVAVLETAEKSQATASSSSTLFKSQEKIEKIEKNTNQIEAKPIVVFVQS
ncbi:tRNA pseudouridine(55) synthase TruB [Gardnerella vaginalis]|uniref:tRNA pseudouridine(55) synthase TruB n=1 Tax=Gardnerella vaginalis TaxID=2702 RepID=UPI00200BB6E0|nr:tRNA pseudouridine(55) synthase TruB [Gardnerella vaginalis]UQA79983.1 tRNA pseudouridine(55) synthase TruB [Gardnerella vaginalis]